MSYIFCGKCPTFFGKCPTFLCIHCTLKRNLMINNKRNRRLLNKKRRLNKVHLEFLKEVIWTISSTPYKITNLKSKFEQNIEDLKGYQTSPWKEISERV